MRFPGWEVAPGFNVMFINGDDYSMDEHFARIGTSVAYVEIGGTGYGGDEVTESHAEAALKDPVVEVVEQNCYGIFD